MLNDLLYYLRLSGNSINKIAEKADISIDKMQNILQGKMEPSLNDLRKLSKVLKIPLTKILLDKNAVEEHNVLYRNRPNSFKEYSAREKISYIIQTVIEDLDGLVNKSNLSLIQHNDKVFDDPILLAEFIRSIFLGYMTSDSSNLGYQKEPIRFLPLILAKILKCYIFCIDVGADGASAIVDNKAFIFVSPRFIPRMLFTVAHEFGHLLAHHNKKDSFLAIDLEIPNGRINNNKNSYDEEVFANTFAINLLLPEAGVADFLKRLRYQYQSTAPGITDYEIIQLSHYFGVSFIVAALRLEDLKLIPKGAAFSLYEEINSSNGSPEKRAREYDIPERDVIKISTYPEEIKDATIQAIRNGKISIGKAAEFLGNTIDDIYQLNQATEL